MHGGKIFGQIKIGDPVKKRIENVYQFVIRKPIQIPVNPPIAVVSTEDKENALAPQRVGMNPPTTEPIAIKIIMIDLGLIQRV